jgi:hypothetical protein
MFPSAYVSFSNRAIWETQVNKVLEAPDGVADFGSPSEGSQILQDTGAVQLIGAIHGT